MIIEKYMLMFIGIICVILGCGMFAIVLGSLEFIIKFMAGIYGVVFTCIGFILVNLSNEKEEVDKGGKEKKVKNK